MDITNSTTIICHKKVLDKVSGGRKKAAGREIRALRCHEVSAVFFGFVGRFRFGDDNSLLSMKKLSGFLFLMFSLGRAKAGNLSQWEQVKCRSFWNKIRRAVALGTGFMFIGIIVTSCGQAPSTDHPVPPTNKVSTNPTVSPATISSAYTVEQLTNLLNAKIDPELFAQQIHKWGIKLDVATIKRLTQNGVKDADLLRIQDAIAFVKTNKISVTHAEIAKKTPTSAPVKVATDVDTNLDTNIVQVFVMFTNNFPVTEIAGHMTRCGMKLNAATIVHLDKAGVTLEQITNLEGVFKAQAAAASLRAAASNSQTASLRLAGVTNLNLAAITNLSMAATNVLMARTNLPVVAEYAQRMATNLWLMQMNGNTNEFSEVTNNLEDIAAGIKGYAANLPLETNFVSRPYQAFITVGAEFLNPYAISVPNPTPNGQGTLTNAGNSTVGFVEFDYINRHVLRSDRGETVSSTNWSRFVSFHGNWLLPTRWPPDVQFNMGFLFNNGTGISNNSYTAQALAGADFYSSLDLGFPIWRLDLTNQSHQVSLEVGGGVGTQKSFELIHPNAFVGLGYETSFRPFLQSSFTNNCGFFEAKAGVGWVDVPSLEGSNNLVRLDPNGIPMFDLRPACELSTYLAYPLTDKIYLTVEAEDYLGYRPPQSWNVKVGVSVPMESVTTVFSSLVGAFGKSQ